GIAAQAKSSEGRLPSVPIAVSLRLRSRWICGKSGDSTRMVSRSAAPESHNNMSVVPCLSIEKADSFRRAECETEKASRESNPWEGCRRQNTEPSEEASIDRRRVRPHKIAVTRFRESDYSRRSAFK